ncbi:MAG: FkbM family methyltransferase [Candidatus Dadabacteria bacterium]
MAVQVANIVKGVLGRWKKGKRQSSFPPLTWMQEKILKHQEDKTVKKLNVGNLKINYIRPYEVLHTYKELFEEEIYRFKSNKQDPFIIDCGANIGMSVLYFKSLYPRANIIAYEPDADNFSLLQSNISENNLTGVEIKQAAVWIENGSISFAATGSQGSQIVSDGNQKAVHIKAERLSDLLKSTKVDFLKMDIEGAELDVVLDCAPYLDNVDHFFVEYHGKVNETEKLEQMLNVLKQKFSVYIKLAADNIAHPFTDKSTGSSFDVQLNIFCYK